MSTQQGFGTWLKQRRKELGLTQKELARGVGCSPVTIEKIEAGERRPSRQIADLLAEFLGVPPDEQPLFARFATGTAAQEGSTAAQGSGADRAPWLALHHSRANLPAPPTPFIGREEQVEEILSLLHDTGVRLLTLTGPPGVGKTRLSLRVAASLVDRFADGVFFIPLASVKERELILSAVAHQLGVKESASGAPLLEELKEFLRYKQLLLVLDNFEQLVPMAPVVAEFLLAVPLLKVLVTSREVLHIYGEHEFDVPPLALPNSEELPALEALSRYEAVRLFIERTRQHAVMRNFSLSEENAASVVEICMRVDGLPLAIELAAARIKDLGSPQAVLAGLQNKLDLLAGGPQDLPPRQQTMHAAINWSYEMLNEEEKRVFRGVSVFVSGFSLDAAEAVLRVPELSSPPPQIIASFVDKSLLNKSGSWDASQEADPQSRRSIRWEMLQTIREYAWAELLESNEAAAMLERHARYYLTLAEEAEPELRGPQQAAWLDHLESDHDNIRAALRWAREEGKVEVALRMSGALWRFWLVRGYMTEGRERLNAALSMEGATGPHIEPQLMVARAKALNGSGVLAGAQSDYQASQALFEASLQIERQLGNKGGVAALLSNLGNIARAQGNYAGARTLQEESLAIREELGDKPGMALSLSNLGNVASDQEDYGPARFYQQRSLEILEELGDMRGVASSLLNLGVLSFEEGDPAAALPLYERSLEIRRELGDKNGIALTLYNMGEVALVQGDYGEAWEMFQETIEMMKALGNKQGVTLGLDGFARYFAVQGLSEHAVRLWGAVEAARKAIGSALMSPMTRVEQDAYAAKVRVELGDEAWLSAWAAGQSMSVEEAVAYANEFKSQGSTAS